MSRTNTNWLPHKRADLKRDWHTEHLASEKSFIGRFHSRGDHCKEEVEGGGQND